MSDLAEVLKDETVRRQFMAMPPAQRAAYGWRMQWLSKAHRHQILPTGDWWSVWLLLAGRGAGKTRTAAEQLSWWAWTEPNTRWLVGAPTSADVRATCFEGDSGLMSVIPPILIKDYNRAFHEITLTNGSLIKGIPASEPERFRGPQFHGGWCCSPHTMIALPFSGQRAIEDIVPGDMVMTRHGPRKVLAAGVSGNPNDLVRIDCGDTNLTVTVDHPILVGDQWVPAGDIKMGDKVWLATNTLMDDMHIELSMSAIMVPSQQVSSSTTRMRIRATTLLRTLRQCLSLSISAITQQAKKTQWLNGKLPLKLLNHYVYPKMQSACIAKNRLFHYLRTGLESFALVPALSNGGAINLSLSHESALFAKKTTQQLSDSKCTVVSDATLNQQQERIELSQLAVLSVERLPNSLTYNLTVEGEHEFIANGIVVHNCDELAAWDYLDAAWDQINFSVRLGKHTRLICTTTPRPKDLIVELIGRDGDDVVVTTASTYDNIANLSSNFQKQIMQYEGTKLGRQEIYAEILDPEESGIVKREMFKLWPNGKEFPKFEYIIQSYDCAYTEKTVNDPTACITFGMFKPLDGPMSVMVIDAWQDRLQYPDLRPKVIEEYDTIFGEGKEKKRVDLILVEDKSAGISLIQDLQRAHLPVRAYNPGRADKMQRLNIVSNIIARGRVWIPESSIRKGYVRDWAEGFVSQICSFPEATHDDFVDACLVGETLIQMADGTTKRIDAVVVGDIVATPDGSQPVTAVFSNGIKEIWEVDAGVKLYGTGNHNVMTNTGWIHIDKLIPNVDTVYMYQQEESWYSKAKKVWPSKQLSSMAKGITVTLKAATRHIADTFQGLVQGFTGMSGFTTTASSQTATMSTTSTGTQVTTTSQTLNACQQDNIGTSTKQSYPHEIDQTSNYATSKASGVRPLNGTVQQKAWLGIRSMSLSLWQRLGVSQRFILSWLSPVSGAASKGLQRLLGRFFVAQAAKQQSQSSALVRAVTNTHTMQQVYDLTVANEHCYYANGILVHNCTQALRYLRDAGWLEIDAPPRDDYDEEDLIDSGMMTTRVNPYAA